MAGGINITIGANAGPFAKALNNVTRRIGRWAARLPGRFARAGIAAGRRFATGLMRTVRRGLIATGVIGAGLISKSISEAGRFEQYEMQFEALLGTAEKAQKRMNEIKLVDLEAPFDITQIATASRMLTVFTENAFAGADALRMMADAAAVTPRPLSEIAYWYGRAYSMIKANRPLGEAVMRLTEMGLVSAQASIQLQRLSKSYSPGAQEQKLAIINAEFRKFEGSAAKLVKTWPGIWSVFTSATKQAFAAVGDAILPLAKVWLQDVIDKMTELRNDGTLTRWGHNVATAAANVRAGIESAIPAFKNFLEGAKKYLGEYESFIESGDFSGALRKSVGDGVAGAIGILKMAIPDFVEIGLEIGAGIASGISDGMDRSLRKTWLGRRTADIGDLVTGKSFRDMREAQQQERDSLNNLAEQIRARSDYKPHALEQGFLGRHIKQRGQDEMTIRRHYGLGVLGSKQNPTHTIIDNPPGGQ